MGRHRGCVLRHIKFGRGWILRKIKPKSGAQYNRITPHPIYSFEMIWAQQGPTITTSRLYMLTSPITKVQRQRVKLNKKYEARQKSVLTYFTALIYFIGI